MLPPVAALWIAIRSLSEFVFPFFPLSKSQRRQLARLSALYTFWEEIRQLKTFPPWRNRRACLFQGRRRQRPLPNILYSPVCRCAAGNCPQLEIMRAASFRSVPVGLSGYKRAQIKLLGRAVCRGIGDFTIYGGDKRIFRCGVAAGCVGFVVDCRGQGLVSPSIPTRKLPSGE